MREQEGPTAAFRKELSWRGLELLGGRKEDPRDIWEAQPLRLGD